MSTINDDELQRIVEEGNSKPSDDKDILAYQRLFSVLNERPEHRSSGIEEAIISRIETSRKRSTLRDYVWLSLGIVFLILIGLIAVAASGITFSLSGWQRTILALGTCAGVVIVLINAAERKLLHR